MIKGEIESLFSLKIHFEKGALKSKRHIPVNLFPYILYLAKDFTETYEREREVIMKKKKRGN